ncbi:transcriptional regulator [Burkholderia sp. AU33803]|nr:transcriptional regulator [Burkholderia sp. AU33803]OXJ01819.1 transcriptional regulator [Burkholderia sp. AU33647]PRD87853.1 transcriptional regulator [Burkholderia contaminans]
MVVWDTTVELHNLPMPTSEEKAAFSERLKFALRRSPEKVTGATELANRFNLRHRGAQPVSPQTAHKWLTGRTIPTSDKLVTLAEWLRVEVHWLHYGPSPSVIEHPTPQPLPRDERYPPTPETIELASKIEALSPHHRYLVQELVEQFYGDSGEAKKG